MHVGNLLPLIVLLHSALYGHTALVLVGGATGTVGDPSGRSTERPALKAEQLQQNVAGIRAQMIQFFHNAAKYLERRGKIVPEASILADAAEDRAGNPLFRRGMDIRILDNLSWFQNVSFLEFLRRVGRFARVNDMVARDSVKTRLGPVDGAERSDAPGLSFTEFAYQLMQAHDFSVLHDNPWRCSVQVGGSDQMGNISAGIDLIRRQRAANNPKSTMKDDPAYGLTIPLLTTESGAKFGKSAGNAVWISSEKCSDLDFYQYFIRSADADVARYLRSLTLLSQSEIEEILEEHAKDKSKRIAQTCLAEEMTELVRGDDALQRAQLATQILFSIKVRDLTLDQVRFAFDKDPRLMKRAVCYLVEDFMSMEYKSKTLKPNWTLSS
ncbi:tyrosine--tRNA ligase [Malassezia vespertilionis]|uniref:tyrosine--tRNA ligase n=1 Tax=Malassezia vespertilionis TaxID=2020962 RepID=UPI0024B06FF6|nr:tyrosine--tRNA ligase [Malassezia vespertilionis]WFD07288.1 tyrosine--tRNA ligase [Malassezia vespertilionis]